MNNIEELLNKLEICYTNEDVQKIQSNMLFLNQRELSKISNRLMRQNKQHKFLESLTEVNFTTQLLRSLPANIDMKVEYEPKTQKRPVDLVIRVSDKKYLLQLKSLSNSIRENKQAQILREIRRKIKEIKTDRGFYLRISDIFKIEHVDELLQFISDNFSKSDNIEEGIKTELTRRREEEKTVGLPSKDLHYETAITQPSTYLHSSDIYLLTLAFKSALGETQFDPHVDGMELDDQGIEKRKLYTAMNMQSAYQEMNQQELQQLVTRNHGFVEQLAGVNKQKFSTVIRSMGSDSSGAGHFININIEQGNPMRITVDDSFSPMFQVAGVEGGTKNQAKRLSTLFTTLFKRPVTVAINEVKPQEAANCGIHAIINKINYEYGLKLNAEELAAPLRAGLNNVYDTGNIKGLTDSIYRLVRRAQQQEVKETASSTTKLNKQMENLRVTPASIPTKQSPSASISSSSSALREKKIELPSSSYQNKEIDVNKLCLEYSGLFEKAISDIQSMCETNKIPQSLQQTALQDLFNPVMKSNYLNDDLLMLMVTFKSSLDDIRTRMGNNKQGLSRLDAIQSDQSEIVKLIISTTGSNTPTRPKK